MLIAIWAGRGIVLPPVNVGYLMFPSLHTAKFMHNVVNASAYTYPVKCEANHRETFI